MLRFAPSPTGDMHIGNLRAAILNFIIAKQRGEKFLIRIEDTDKARNIDGADKEILAILNLFGLFWDKLVYQSDNFKIHNELAKQLIDKGEAFYCYATKEFLDKKREEALAQKRAFRYDDSWAEICKGENPNPVIRLKGDFSNDSSLRGKAEAIHKSKMDCHDSAFAESRNDGAKDSHTPYISFIDEIKGECKFSQNEIDSFVIVRDDKIPTYNFACAVDDMIYDISFIIRGEDHTSNTPKQMLVHKKLGYTKEIKYAHLPIILNDCGRKMSKRESESSVKWLLESGFLPRAILNYLLLMGNNPPCEIFTLDEAIEWFDLSQLSKSPVRFDMNLLRHINREHLKRLSENEMGLLLESSSVILAKVGNSPLELHSVDSANFGVSQTPSLVSTPKFAENYESQTENPSVVLNAESNESSLRGRIADSHEAIQSCRHSELSQSESEESKKINKRFVDSLGSLGKIFLEESSTLNEICAKIERIFAPKVLSDDFRVYGAEIAILKSTLLELLKSNDESLQDFNALKAKLGESCKIDDKPLKGKGLFMPLRFLLTGAGNGPHLDILYPHLRAHLKIILRFKGD